jgi:hypothetical protein
MDTPIPPGGSEGRSLRRKLLKITGLYVILVAAATGSYLLAPPARANDNLCGRTVHLGGLLSFPLNCDSPELVLYAIEPGRLLNTDSTRQDRPLYVAAAALLTRVLVMSSIWRLVPKRAYQSIAALHQGTGINEAELFLCAYLAYVLMNAALVLVTLLLFHWLVAQQWSVNLIVVGFAMLLLTNDVVKAFFWTPHLQLFNLVVPLSSVAISQQLYRYPDRSMAWMVGLGGAMGLLSLAYGSFVICVACGAAVLALKIRWQQFSDTLRRFVTRSGAMAIGFALPTLVWMEICKFVVGSYYNHELVHYHEFIWVIDSAHLGLRELSAKLIANMHLFVRVMLPVVPFAALLFVVVLITGMLVRAPLRAIFAERLPAFIAIALTTIACFGFFYFTGFYEQRLGQNLAIPILLSAAILGFEIVRRTRLSFAMAAASIWVLVFGRLGYEVVKAGPWS